VSSTTAADGVAVPSTCTARRSRRCFALCKVFYHWGAIIVPLGYTAQTVYAREEAGRFQGRRIARFAQILADARVRHDEPIAV
jgi:hypothetical protein